MKLFGLYFTTAKQYAKAVSGAFLLGASVARAEKEEEIRQLKGKIFADSIIGSVFREKIVKEEK